MDHLTTALADRYRIERELGSGGMATVYLAEDLKHHRHVAVKVLRPELSAIIGGERFLKEIEVTANLQHPNILPLYDSGEAHGPGSPGTFLYYVMPYVEDETLRSKLDRERQLGVEETIEITKAVASALEYAHERGIVHRDIKPANILLQSGQALVADFGIALAVSAAGGTRLTETGLSLGTPHYMSPEQATGDRTLDARSDVYALGCVTYEMLAGDPPHTGSTVQAIIAKIVTDRPRPLQELRDTVPPHVAAAVDTALAKLPADRFGSAGQFAAALTDTSYKTATTSTPVSSAHAQPAFANRWKHLAVLGFSLAAILLALTVWFALRPNDVPAVRFKILLEDDVALSYSGTFLTLPRLAITPDGASIVYTGVVPGAANTNRLMLRALDQLQARPLSGTENAGAPEISPDGNDLAFIADGVLKVASLSGGPAVTVADSGVGSFGSWGPDGYLYFLDQSSLKFRRVSRGGGPVEDVAELEPFPDGAVLRWPHVLPDGKGAIATVGTSDPARLAEHEIRAIDFATGESKPLVVGIYAIYSASGHLLYVTAGGVLMAVPFDAGGRRVRGRPVALIEGVDWRNNSTSDLAASRTGNLIYVTDGLNAPERMVWAERDGRMAAVDSNWIGDIEFEGLALSPDGTRLAVEIVTAGRSDIWVKQLPAGPLSRLTFEGSDKLRPVWKPDGRSVAFVTRNTRGSPEVWTKRADGSGPAERVLGLDRAIFEVMWSSDGDWLVLSVGGTPSDDILMFNLSTDSTPKPLIAGPADEYEPAISPDGKWLAYVSEESGSPEIFVRPFPNVSDGKWQVSTEGGIEPLWNRNGGELYYRTTDGRTIMAATLVNGPSAAERRVLLKVPEGGGYEVNRRNRLYDITPDGRRFLMSHQTGEGDLSGDLVFVQNFFRELKRKVAR